MKNNFYNLIGGGGRMLIFLVTVPLMVKFMGVEKYGLWILLTSVGNIALMLDAGLTAGTMFFVSAAISSNNSAENVKKIITSLFIINVIIVSLIIILFLVLNPLIYDLFFVDYITESNIKSAIIGVGIYTAILLSQKVFMGIIQSYDNFKIVNVIKFTFLLILNVGLVIMSSLEYSFFSMVSWMIFSCFLALTAYFIITLKYINLFKMKFIYDKISFIDVSKYTFNTWFGYAGNVLFGQMDKIVLGLVSTPSVVGIYSAIISLTTYINSLATVGLQPAVPKIAKLYPQFEKNKNKIRDYFNFTLEFNTVLICCLALFLLPFIDFILYDFMKISYNPKENISFYFFIAIIIYAINSIYVPGFYTLMAIKETKVIGRIQMFSALIALTLVYVLGKNYGLLGAIIGNIGFIITHYFNYKVSYKLSKNIFSWLQPLLIYLIAFFITVIVLWIFSESLVYKIICMTFGIGLILLIFIKRNLSETKNLIFNK